MRLRITPGGALRGELRVASDKSISHRAVIFAAIARGTSRVTNLLQGEDVRATMGAMQQMGISIQHLGDAELEIHGVGLRGLCPPTTALNLGNSGTALRLLAGLLCGQNWSSTLDGDASLRARPMARIIKPLTAMGANIASDPQSDPDKPPLTISPVPRLRGIRYQMPVASAQVKSCLLLAGLIAEGATTLIEPAPSRDHTERMLPAFGVNIRAKKGEVCLAASRGAVRELRACSIAVPADLSSAAFFLVGASIIRGSDVLLRNVGINPSRSGVLTILKRMGANLDFTNHTMVGGEPVADIRVRTAKLRACRIAGDDIALAIDEIPVIAVAAAVAEGTTEIRDAAELRIKESDRIRSMVTALTALGIAVTEHTDGLSIVGGALAGGRVDSHTDHRIAMALAIAGGAAQDMVEVANCENIATSFPDFCQIANQAGLNLQIDREANHA